jgi:HD superfamily phosphohydrolase YqeK
VPTAPRPEELLSLGQPRKSYWPYMLLATFAVTVLPLLVVAAIQSTGGLGSTLSSVAAAAALSVGISVAGSALWTRHRGSRDVVFADLMIWGWVRRLRTERRLADAGELLGDRASLTPSRQAELLERLSTALEARDAYTYGHSRRVTRHSEAIARRMGLTQAQIAMVRTAAAVHDVGKIRTPQDILNKPGKLTDEEFAAVKLHPVHGAELVAGIGDPELTAIVRHHHERLDGRGYPDCLHGQDIPLGARIIAVADTFDAITSTRAYRGAAKHKTALDILKKEAGSQLDPAAVQAFLSYYSGSRTVARWSLLVGEPPRFLWWLLGWLQGAGVAPITKGVVAAGAAALMGSTLASPPSPQASIRSTGAATAVAQRPADRVPVSGSAAAASTPRQTKTPSPRSRDRTGRRPQQPSRRRSGSAVGPLKQPESPGSRSFSGSDNLESGAGSGGGGSAGPTPGSPGDGSPVDRPTGASPGSAGSPGHGGPGPKGASPGNSGDRGPGASPGNSGHASPGTSPGNSGHAGPGTSGDGGPGASPGNSDDGGPSASPGNSGHASPDPGSKGASRGGSGDGGPAASPSVGGSGGGSSGLG